MIKRQLYSNFARTTVKLVMRSNGIYIHPGTLLTSPTKQLHTFSQCDESLSAADAQVTTRLVLDESRSDIRIASSYHVLLGFSLAGTGPGCLHKKSYVWA